VFCKLDDLWCSVWCRNIAGRCHSLQSVEIPCLTLVQSSLQQELNKVKESDNKYWRHQSSWQKLKYFDRDSVHLNDDGHLLMASQHLPSTGSPSSIHI
jgi:hypothetical protein